MAFATEASTQKTKPSDLHSPFCLRPLETGPVQDDLKRPSDCHGCRSRVRCRKFCPIWELHAIPVSTPSSQVCRLNAQSLLSCPSSYHPGFAMPKSDSAACCTWFPSVQAIAHLQLRERSDWMGDAARPNLQHSVKLSRSKDSASPMEARGA